MISNHQIKYIIVIVVVIASAVTIWFGIIRYTFGVNNPFYVVSSGSMIPNLNVGDYVIIKHSDSNSINDNSSFNRLKIGDIIIFKTPGVSAEGEHKVIVHRVAQIINADSTNEERIIRTKGDANPYSIRYLDYPIKEENYIGKVVYVIPKVGLITRAIAPPVNYVIIGVIGIILIYYIKKQKNIDDKKQKNIDDNKK
jgi:signal peptidase I